MELIKQRLSALLKSTTVNFFEEYEDTTPLSTGFYAEVTSKTAGEDYAFMRNSRRMRKFLGERIARKLESMSFYIPNEEWEDTIEVARKDLADDTTGKYEAEARGIASSVKLLDDDQLTEYLLPNGETALAMDGQNFFDTDHAYEVNGVEKTQSNLLTDVTLDQAGFSTALAAFKNLRDAGGRSVNRSGNTKITLVVPAALEAAAEAIVNTRTLDGGADNPNYQKAEVLVLDLEDDNDWYLINTGGSGLNKPFIKQTREFEPMKNTADGDTDFHNRIFYFGTYWRGAYGYGLYQMALKVKNA